MSNREKVIRELEDIQKHLDTGYSFAISWKSELIRDALALLEEQESLLGIHQTADSITFVSTGTAQQGESRGLLLGKLAMHEWFKKELLYRGLLTDEIRAVFDEAKRQ